MKTPASQSSSLPPSLPILHSNHHFTVPFPLHHSHTFPHPPTPNKHFFISTKFTSSTAPSPFSLSPHIYLNCTITSTTLTSPTGCFQNVAKSQHRPFPHPIKMLSLPSSVLIILRPSVHTVRRHRHLTYPQSESTAFLFRSDSTPISASRCYSFMSRPQNSATF